MSKITQKTWELRHENNKKKYTCYYSPSEKHSLCPHPQQCILNKESMDLRADIEYSKKKIKHLKEIYDIAYKLHKKDKTPYDSIFYNFYPKKNVFERKVLENKIKNNYRKLKQLKTKKGGY